MLLNSSEEGYDADVSCLHDALVARGYPRPLLSKIPFSHEQRLSRLSRLASRGSVPSDERRSTSNVMIFKTCFSTITHKVGLKKRWFGLVNSIDSDLSHLSFRVAHSANANSFMITYKHNFCC